MHAKKKQTHTPKSYLGSGKQDLVPLTKYTSGEVIINSAAIYHIYCGIFYNKKNKF